jgi:uncharacterized iron-regulated membrane protein
MTLRKLFFWMHLGAGTIAGIVILIMSVTGVLLSYEKQIIAWSDRGFRSAPAQGTARLPVETLLAKVRDSEHALPVTMTLWADSDHAAEASFGRERTVFVNPYSGEVLGEGSKKTRAFFHGVEDWHRWIALEGASRSTGRAVTGVCNLVPVSGDVGFLYVVSAEVGMAACAAGAFVPGRISREGA